MFGGEAAGWNLRSGSHGAACSSLLAAVCGRGCGGAKKKTIRVCPQTVVLLRLRFGDVLSAWSFSGAQIVFFIPPRQGAY